MWSHGLFDFRFEYFGAQMPHAILTIDDFPTRNSKELLDYLHRLMLPAILFCVGDQLEGNLELSACAVKMGFVLGNHSYSHKRFSELSINEIRDELHRTESLIDKAYRRAGVKRGHKLFRFPYGDKGAGYALLGTGHRSSHEEEIQKLLRDLGFCQPVYNSRLPDTYINSRFLNEADVYWTLETRDWSANKAAGSQYTRIPDLVKQLRTKVTSICEDELQIVLMHDSWNTIDVFKTVLLELQRLNFDFLSIVGEPSPEGGHETQG